MPHADAPRSVICRPRLASRKLAAGVRTYAAASLADAGYVSGPLKYQHIMLALVDPSPYFGDGSKQARSAPLHCVVKVLDCSVAPGCQPHLALRCADFAQRACGMRGGIRARQRAELHPQATRASLARVD